MCVYIYIINIHSTHILCKQQHLFWMRLIAIYRLTALFGTYYWRSFSTVAERAQRAATSENTCKQTKHQQIKKTSSSIWQQVLQMLTTQTNKEFDLQCVSLVVFGVLSNWWRCFLKFAGVCFLFAVFLYLVVLWVFAVRFFIWLCCEYLQRECCQIVLLIWRCFFYLQRVELSRPLYFSLHTMLTDGLIVWTIVMFLSAV